MPIARSASGHVRRSIGLVAAGLAVAMLSACDKHSPASPGANPRQVTVYGSGQIQGAPDTLIADVAIEFIAPDVTSAMNQVNDRLQAVISALVGAGMDRKDIRTTQVTLKPEYGVGSAGTSTITGYRADNSINVKIHPPDAASRLLALVVSTGGDATRISAVNYSIEDDSQLVKDARARAFQDAKNRAEEYAQLSGLRLGKVLSISEATNTTPPQSGPAAGGMSPVPLEPGQEKVTFSVTAVWELS